MNYSTEEPHITTFSFEIIYGIRVLARCWLLVCLAAWLPGCLACVASWLPGLPVLAACLPGFLAAWLAAWPAWPGCLCLTSWLPGYLAAYLACLACLNAWLPWLPAWPAWPSFLAAWLPGCLWLLRTKTNSLSSPFRRGPLWEGDFRAAPAGPLWGTKTSSLSSPYRRGTLWEGDFRAAPARPLWGTKTTSTHY